VSSRRHDSRLELEAGEVAGRLQSIRQLLRGSILEQARHYPVSLTAPQLLTLELLVDRQRSRQPAPSLRELAEHLGLAHSTVSGIVDRLEAAGIVMRRARRDDRRYRQVELSARAKKWLARELPRARDRPLTAALARATAGERRSVMQGLRLLQELLVRAASAGDDVDEGVELARGRRSP
jgi:DNA-binding MarR family transcriptional regulator